METLETGLLEISVERESVITVENGSKNGLGACDQEPTLLEIVPD